MENSQNNNYNDKDSLIEKPDIKKEPISTHDAGLTNENEELYSNPEKDGPKKAHFTKGEKALEDSKDNDADGVDYFVDEEDILNSQNSPEKRNSQDAFDKEYGKDSIK
ncbi:hypothetical protein [Flavobacterium algicola]|uniref:hypothetical protein n=1 Tax=Flavobacterium algicola TaxID=556529 RepID=UPI001EFEC1EC|nr:hypothetical protein [Flavobacterium algicola]MCG9793327.1 hypothetical protein [Flavobacterium algicola]